MPPSEPPVDSIIDQFVTFFVHTTNETSSIIITLILIGFNYHSLDGQCALIENMNLKFIDGTITILVDSFDPIWGSWNRSNMRGRSWIMNYVLESIAQPIVLKNTVVHMVI